MNKRIDWKHFLLSSLAAFFAPIATSLIQGHNITTALHLGLGIALAHGIGFVQDPRKNND